MCASGRGHVTTVKILLATGADLTLRTSPMCRISLHSALDLAAVNGRGDVVVALLEHGADINAASPNGKTALHLVTQYKQGVGLLLDAGASVHNKTVHGCTPLHFAAGRTNVRAMRALLRRGASVNETNTRGSTALHLACAAQRPRVEAAVGLLLRWGGSETAVGSGRLTPAGLLEQLAYRRRCSLDEAELARGLLVRAPVDRAWRRRCWVVMLRARAERERMAQCMGSSSSGGGGGEVGQDDHGGSESESIAGESCAKSRHVEVARTDDGVGTQERAQRERVRRGLVAALVGLELEGVFRTIVGYLYKRGRCYAVSSRRNQRTFLS